MKAYLAPIYCQTNSLSQEKLTLGLILFAVEPFLETPTGVPATIFFKLSEKKAQIAEKLTGVSKSFFTTTEKYIQNVIEDLKKQPPLFGKLSKKSPLTDKDVYQYLQKYAHGLVEFGALKPFSGPINQSVFEKLFADFTGDTTEVYSVEGISIVEKSNFAATLKEYLHTPQLKEKADINYKFTPDKLPGILKPTKAELITVNGQVESLHSLNFAYKNDTISNHLNELEVYYYALKDYVADKSQLDKLTIAFNPPESKSNQEKLFNTAVKQKSSLFKFLPINEVDDFAQSVTTEDYRKFSEVFK